jgi:molybdopterin molybdotransferase
MPTGRRPSLAETLRGGTVEAARTRMLAATTRLAPESVGLSDAFGRTLAEPVVAVRDQPPLDVSAMDGWAVRGSDLADGAAVLSVVGESAAGRPFDGGVASGEAVRISTGAPVPAGATRVVIQEEATLDRDQVRLSPAPGASAHIRRRGGDFRAGEGLLEAGARLDAWRLALVAAAGRAEVVVTRRPRVAILTTGDELIPGGLTPAPSAIFDSAGPALAALVAGWGGEAQRPRSASDDLEAIAAAVSQAGTDLLVTVGGASVGDHDLVKPALRRFGLRLLVETVNVRPGKPVWFGVLDEGRAVLGLPGNPASAFVCAELFLRPLLMAMQGAETALPVVRVRLRAPLPAEGPREHWLRASLETDEDGVIWAQPFPDQDSAMVGVFSRADALLRRPARSGAARDGDVVEAVALGRL